jgi:D-alanyl-D-alanine carboxypeptidase/D-alanyl-D-alanine-endopeptidase (penicillin-binding protein 4)
VAHAAAAAALLSPAVALSAENHDRLEAKLGAVMRQASGASGAYVYDITDRRALYSRRATNRRILASNTKIFTTGAVLSRFGPSARFSTEVLADRRPGSEGVVRGRLYLRGGGDPSFGSESFGERAYGGVGGATVAELASQVERAGVTRVTGGVFGDEGLFDSLRGGPDSGYGTSVWVGPLSALSFNRGLAREQGTAFQRNPPEFAAQKLAAALERRGIRVDGPAGVRAAPDDARLLAEAKSISLERLVQITNTTSDNFFAETLAKHMDAAPGHPGTTAGGSGAVAGFARRLGAQVRLVDGSGLARANIGTPRGVVRFLRGMQRRREYRALYGSFAVPGRYGTLEERGASRRCRGKTGTIRGVSNLSGYCRTQSGDLIAFSFLMNRVGTNYDRARDLQDRMTWVLSRYG